MKKKLQFFVFAFPSLVLLNSRFQVCFLKFVGLAEKRPVQTSPCNAAANATLLTIAAKNAKARIGNVTRNIVHDCSIGIAKKRKIDFYLARIDKNRWTCVYQIF